MEKITELSARQKFIIRSLLEESPLDVREISKQMDVSERTVFREISFINSVLQKNNIKILSKNSRLTVSGESEQVESLKQSIGGISKRYLLTSEQRILFITAELLLADEPYKSSFFSFQLNVVEGTISLYMDKIQQWLSERNLSLNRKRRYGMKVDGSEWNKRNALVALIYDYKPVDELLPYIYETRDDPVIHSFFDILFGSRTLQISKGIMESVSDSTAGDDVSYLSSLLHVMISVKKSKDGHPIILPADFIQEVLSIDDFSFGNQVRDFLRQYSLEMTESEIVYIYVHLPGRYLYSAEKRFRALGVSLDQLAEEIVYETQKKLGKQIGRDEQLIPALSNYLNLVIYRISMGIQVKNSMLEQVRKYYGGLFDAVELACKLVFSKYNIQLSRDEIGFITMCMGTALEKGERPDDRFSILLVCPNGVFASRILLNKVQDVVRDMDHIDVKSLKEWSESDCEKYDMILSTVDIGMSRKGRRSNLLVVSPFLDGDDVARINECIKNIRDRAEPYGIPFSFPPAEIVTGDSEGDSLIRHMAESIWLETIRMDSFENMVETITSGLYDRKIVADRSAVGELILKRQKIGSVVIPNSHVSLLHTRSDFVNAPFIGVYRLDEDMMMESAGFDHEPVDTFLVLLARNKERPAVLEKMGDISIALIEDKNFPGMLRQCDMNALRAKFMELLDLKAE